MTRKRVVNHAGAAWIAAVAGAWLVAAACRTMQGGPPSTRARRLRGGPRPSRRRGAPSIRVGILTDVKRVSIGADSGVPVRGRAPGETAVRLRTLPRATFRPARGGPPAALETGDELDLASVSPAVPAELLEADASATGGSSRSDPPRRRRLTVVNVVYLEDYLRGVVPNELSPQAFPQIEALKAQAVAARTYALSHLGDYSAEGLRRLRDARPARSTAGSPRSTPSPTARSRRRGGSSPRGGAGPSTRTTRRPAADTPREASAIFDDDAPYLRGVACLPGALVPPRRADDLRPPARPPGRAGDRPRRRPPRGPRRDRRRRRRARRLEGIPTDAEVRAWTVRLQAALHRSRCDSPVSGSLARRATFARHLVASACWSERAERLLAPGDAEYLSQVEDTARLDGGERQAVALLVHEGLLSPAPDNTLRPDAALTRAEALALLARRGREGRRAGLAEGELAGLAGGALSVLHGETADSHPLDTGVRLFRDLDGVHAGTSELTLSVGDRVVYVERAGLVVYLEAEQSRRGAADRARQLQLGGPPRPRPTWPGRSGATARWGRSGTSSRSASASPAASWSSASSGRRGSSSSRGCRCAGAWACARTSSS